MPLPRISAGAAVFRMAVMDVSVFNHDAIAAIVSQALVARQFLHFPSRPVPHSNATISGSDEHTSELPSLLRNSFAVFCLKKTTEHTTIIHNTSTLCTFTKQHDK